MPFGPAKTRKAWSNSVNPSKPEKEPLTILLPEGAGTWAAFTRAGRLSPLGPGMSKFTSASISLRRKGAASFWGAGPDLRWVFPMNVMVLVELGCVCAMADAAVSKHTPPKDKALMVFILFAP